MGLPSIWLFSLILPLLLSPVRTIGWTDIRVCDEGAMLVCPGDHRLICRSARIDCLHYTHTQIYQRVARDCYKRREFTVNLSVLLSGQMCTGKCMLLEVACVNPLRIHLVGSDIADRWGFLQSPNYPQEKSNPSKISSSLKPGAAPEELVEVSFHLYDYNCGTAGQIQVCPLRYNMECEPVNVSDRCTTVHKKVKYLEGINILILKPLTTSFLLEYMFTDSTLLESRAVFEAITVYRLRDRGQLHGRPYDRKPIIIGVTLGAAVLVLAVIIAIVVAYRKRRNRKNGTGTRPTSLRESNVYVVDRKGEKRTDIGGVTDPIHNVRPGRRDHDQMSSPVDRENLYESIESPFWMPGEIAPSDGGRMTYENRPTALAGNEDNSRTDQTRIPVDDSCESVVSAGELTVFENDIYDRSYLGGPEVSRLHSNRDTTDGGPGSMFSSPGSAGSSVTRSDVYAVVPRKNKTEC